MTTDYAAIEKRTMRHLRDFTPAQVAEAVLGRKLNPGQHSSPRPRMQNLPIQRTSGALDYIPARTIRVDPSWTTLPGWPARCPGAGTPGRGWRAIAMAAQHSVLRAPSPSEGPAWSSAMCYLDIVRALLRHPSLKGEARQAIEDAVTTSDMLAMADSMDGDGPDRLYMGVDFADIDGGP